MTMPVVCKFKTSVKIQQKKKRHAPEDGYLCSHHREIITFHVP